MTGRKRIKLTSEWGAVRGASDRPREDERFKIGNSIASPAELPLLVPR